MVEVQANKERLLDFVLGTQWDDLNTEVQHQALKCFFDLSAVICAGAKNNSSRKISDYVKDNYPTGTSTILAGMGGASNLLGASLANGMAANALDLDDGYSLLRGHPGAGFFGAILTAAEYSDCSYKDVLTALAVAYEVAIRQGYAIRNFYGWDHSSGSWAAFGACAAVCRLLGLNREETEMALGIADFISPLVPAKRSCYIPSMNKDGIYWGNHIGMQAALMSKAGITGKNPVLLGENYTSYINSLGCKWYMFDLYVKFYSCCRWAHSPIGAVESLMKDNNIQANEIEHVDVYSFGNAGTLYKKTPTTEDEAQYNICYPIAAQILFGHVGPIESSTTRMLDERVKPMIDKIEFHHEPEYDKVFPAKRLSRVEIVLKNGRLLRSEACEPKGDVNATVSLEDLVEKAYAINGVYSKKETIEAFIKCVKETDFCEPFSKVFSSIKKLAVENIHSEIVFI